MKARAFVVLLSCTFLVFALPFSTLTTISLAQEPTNLPSKNSRSKEIGEIIRVSLDSNGNQGNGDSRYAVISADGDVIAFSSSSNNLVSSDTNGYRDIFIHDRASSQTSRISLSSDGLEGNNDSDGPSISDNGKVVAFYSLANNLVKTDKNGFQDVFVHYLDTGETKRISVSSNGTESDSGSGVPSVSADGTLIAFHSWATNLVEDDNNGTRDVFVHDLTTGKTTRLSVDSNGNEGDNISGGPSISNFGRFVAFWSKSSNLVIGDANNAFDVFVHDRQTGETTRISKSSSGIEANDASDDPSISADGRFVAFVSSADNLVTVDTNTTQDIFVHDRNSSQTIRVSIASDGTQANGSSYLPSISSDGRYVTFHSDASNLVSDDKNNKTDVFVHDMLSGETTRISIANDGTEGNDISEDPYISADGRFIVFHSIADSLVHGDTNGVQDVFVYDREAQPPNVFMAYLPLSIKYYLYFEGPWEQEDNNSISQANSPILSNQVYKGKHNDQDDYFGFSIMNPGKITIDMNSNHTKTDQNGNSVVQTLLYYQDKGNLVKNQAGSSAHIEHNATEEGWYFVRIYTVPDYVDSSKEYSLSVTYP